MQYIVVQFYLHTTYCGACPFPILTTISLC